jgi:molecular chaperone GrpE
MTKNVDEQVGAADRQPSPDEEGEELAEGDATEKQQEDEVAMIREALALAQQEAAENQDKYLRARADMENYKKRIERTYADLAKSAKKDLLRKLLSVKDNLERALQYGETAEGGAGEGIIEGVRLTQYQLDQLLAQEGVQPIEAKGQPFDPQEQEAIHSVSDDQVPDHTVVEVVRKGYRYQDEVLRPAQVVVSVHDRKEQHESD